LWFLLAVRQELGGDWPPPLPRAFPRGRGAFRGGPPCLRELLPPRPPAPGTGESGPSPRRTASNTRSFGLSDRAPITESLPPRSHSPRVDRRESGRFPVAVADR